MESDIQHKVSDSISKLEIALSEWDSAKPEERPPDIKKQIKHLRSSHELLCKWMRDSLTGSKDPASIVARLSGFVVICNDLGSTQVK